MANKNLFKSKAGGAVAARKADTTNAAGGKAYELDTKSTLAVFACTGTFNNQFYTSAEEQLDVMLDRLRSVNDDEFLAKLAVYGRRSAFMKDAPALIAAYLMGKNPALFEKVFPKVVDNGRMLRTFTQMVMSGVAGRRGIGHAPKRVVSKLLNERDYDDVFRWYIGNDPSMRDILRFWHPKPKDAERAELFKWMLGKTVEGSLAGVAAQFVAWKAAKAGKVDAPGIPDVPFQMLTDQELTPREWAKIAEKMPWNTLRMNLNTLARHKVFDDHNMRRFVERRLRDMREIRNARVFPYAIMAAYMHSDSGVPTQITEALHDALEIATDNVPEFPGYTFVCPDVSGSMTSPVTGYRGGGTSKMRCVDVAALVAASVLRKNPQSADVLPFDTSLHAGRLSPRDTVMTNAQKLAQFGGGGTACSLPLNYLLNDRQFMTNDPVTVIYVSDNESWADYARGVGFRYGGYGTPMMDLWTRFKLRCPNAKLVCIDIHATNNSQVDVKDPSVLLVAGFSDNVFKVISNFAQHGSDASKWIEEIEKTMID